MVGLEQTGCQGYVEVRTDGGILREGRQKLALYFRREAGSTSPDLLTRALTAGLICCFEENQPKITSAESGAATDA
jgi:hypothetical protein